VCMEGVEPPLACVSGPQRFSVHASEAFTVIGGRSGYLHRMIKDPSGASNTCVLDPTISPTIVGRIPLRNLQPCKVPEPTVSSDPSVNPASGGFFTGQLADGTFESDPCLVQTEVPQFDSQLQGPLQCDAVPQPSTGTLGTRTTPAIRFRNPAMTLNLVDPYKTCILGAGGEQVTLPFAPAGYSIEFAQKAAFSPSTAVLGLVGQANLVKVVRGPGESIWVVDDGDVLASTSGTISSAGRVYRVESVSPIIVSNVME
jgi:hypothetical protein